MGGGCPWQFTGKGGISGTPERDGKRRVMAGVHLSSSPFPPSQFFFFTAVFFPRHSVGTGPFVPADFLIQLLFTERGHASLPALSFLITAHRLSLRR